MVQGLSGAKAFRRRKFIFYWISLEEQISIQACKPECLERNSFLETLAFLSSLFSLSDRSIFPCKTSHDCSWNATQKSGNSSLGSQSGEAQRQFLKSWNTSHKHELHVGLRGSDWSRSDFFFGCRHSRPFLGSVTVAIFTQGWRTTLSRHLHKLKPLFFLAIIYNSRLEKKKQNTKNQPKTKTNPTQNWFPCEGILIAFHGRIEWHYVFKAQAASWVKCKDEEEKYFSFLLGILYW